MFAILKKEERAGYITGTLYLLIRLTFGATLSGWQEYSYFITEAADAQRG